MNTISKLPCTAFEELMLSHDFEGFPCTICLKMVVSGFIVREHFQTSVMQMLEQNPLMRSRLTRRFGRSIWQIQSQIEQVVHWKTADTNPEWPATSSIDLAVHHGLKLEVHQTGREDSHIFATVHHAVADGQGIIAAFHEMWLCYDSLCRGDTVPRIERSQDRLRDRNRFGLTGLKLLGLLPKLSVGLAGVRQYLMRSPVPIVAHNAIKNVGVPEASIHAITHQFSTHETESLRQAARRGKWNLNELLTAAIFIGSSASNVREALSNGNDWIRMMVPFSMRTPADYREQSAANIVSCVFLDRTRNHIQDHEALLQSIQSELELIKKNRLPLIFNFSIWIKKMLTFNGSRPKKAAPKRCETSLVFSNLGKLFLGSKLVKKEDKRLVAGQARVESIEILAPLAPWMCIAWIALQYAERLSLTLRFDSRVVGSHKASEMLATSVNHLKGYAEESNVS